MTRVTSFQQEMDDKFQFYRSAAIWDVCRDNWRERGDNAEGDVFRRGDKDRGMARKGLKRSNTMSDPSQLYDTKTFPDSDQTEDRTETGRATISTSFRNCTDHWKYFARDTTFHGVRQFENMNRRRLSRAIWMFLVLCMAVALITTVAILLLEYYEYNTVTRSDMKIVTSIPFPSITICNLCPFKNVEDNKSSMMRHYLANGSIMKKKIFYDDNSPDFGAFMNTTLETIYKKYSFTAWEMFFWTTYDNKIVNVTDAFEVTDTCRGPCFTFNGPEYIAKHGVRHTDSDGRYSGLHFYAKLHQDQYFVHDDVTAGLRMYITNHPDTPRMREDGIDIHPGTSILVALQPITQTFLPSPYKSYGDETCEDTGELDAQNRMVNATFYSHEKCVEQCKMLKAFRHCSCYSPLLYIDGLKKCTLRDVSDCVDPFLATVPTTSCDCPRPCTYTTFHIEISASQMPSMPAAQIIMNLTNETSIQFTRDNYLDVRVFMKNMLIRHERHEPQYSFNSIFASLGGQMGFFMGASLLTIAELIELMIYTVYLFVASQLRRFDHVATKTTKTLRHNTWM